MEVALLARIDVQESSTVRMLLAGLLARAYIMALRHLPAFAIWTDVQVVVTRAAAAMSAVAAINLC